MKDKYEYNRFVLIGNGFDLSLGMSTSYNDFLLYFIKKHFEIALNEGVSDTPIFKVARNSISPDKIWIDSLIQFNDVNTLIQKYSQMLTIQKKSTLYLFLMNNDSNKRWVDIEQLYFELLQIEFEYYVKKNRLERDIKNIKQLNEQLQFLSTELKEYLSQVQNDNKIPDSFTCNFFVQNMHGHLDNDAFYKSHGSEALSSSRRSQNLFFINFNYTNFLRNVIYDGGGSTNGIIPIHGELSDQNEEIIFGYGDDMNKTYKEMELENSNELLEHIKSFHYLKTPYYREVLSNIEEKPFEVFIYGHSCGLSDRTFLTTLFEHKNCKAIKIFHRGCKEEHRRKAMNISRHFNDKFKMRARILDFDMNARVLQAIKPEV